MSTAGFALAFHTLLLLRLRVLILNPTFYHQFRPRRSSRCSPPAWTSRQDGLCLILYTFQFHHSATILGPPICTCCLIQSQETQNPRLGLPPRTRSQRVTTEWLPKDFPSNVTPKGSIWMWVLRVKGVMGREQGVVILALNQRWVWDEAFLPWVFYVSGIALGWVKAPTNTLPGQARTS